MKKISFHNPASPWFFHVAVILLYILIFLLLFGFAISVNPNIILLDNLLYLIIYNTLFFSTLYPFFSLQMARVVKTGYINTHQASIPEKFANKLVLYNRYLITAIYIFSLGVGVFEVYRPPEGSLGLLFLLVILGVCYFFYRFVMPVIIKSILL